ncbi:RsbT co-antagonist protein RsbRB [Planococcus massiliensis]|uniref:RsbT co-antagonist protein RsbRB n=1 Tax=Planococcus massiliensis TaxID=1499687 RepID=A0A098EGZ0_9BACL|nr:STAS domain-containing protein [Planococcus massiliensis]CEG21564.1 RsbT co-antagonist protein RsbRB [Planococcus massiliensis]
MDKEIKMLGSRVEEERYVIAELIQEEVSKNISFEEAEQLASFIDAVTEFRAGFIGLLAQSFEHFLDPQTAYDEISMWGEKTGNYFLDQNMALDAALAETSLYRKHIGKLIKTEAMRNQIKLERLFEIMEYFHTLLDHAAYSYSFAYIHSYQKSLKDAHDEFMKLSAPVVPVNDQIAILPLIGEIDIDRAQYILEKTLMEASRLKISTLILDLSGVVKVDAVVAEQIIRVTQSLKLIGVHSMLTGIRPEIAQTIISLGIDISELSLGGSLKQTFKKLTDNQ